MTNNKEGTLHLTIHISSKATSRMNGKNKSSKNNAMGSSNNNNKNFVLKPALRRCNSNSSSQSSSSTCEYSSSSSSSSSQQQETEKSVQFNYIEIREHERLMDVNPSVSSGPAVGLGWLHYDFPIKYDVLEYELARIPQRRSHKLQFQMPRYHRETLLLDLGYSRQDITANMKEINVTKRQRRISIRQRHFDKVFLAGEYTSQWIQQKILRRRRS